MLLLQAWFTADSPDLKSEKVECDALIIFIH